VNQLEVKSRLAGLTLTQEDSKKEQKGCARNCAAADFVKALWQLYKCCEKCVIICSGNVKKTYNYKLS
jgi:hypothetical protein